MLIIIIHSYCFCFCCHKIKGQKTRKTSSYYSSLFGLEVEVQKTLIVISLTAELLIALLPKQCVVLVNIVECEAVVDVQRQLALAVMP